MPRPIERRQGAIGKPSVGYTRGLPASRRHHGSEYICHTNKWLSRWQGGLCIDFFLVDKLKFHIYYSHTRYGAKFVFELIWFSKFSIVACNEGPTRIQAQAYGGLSNLSTSSVSFHSPNAIGDNIHPLPHTTARSRIYKQIQLLGRSIWMSYWIGSTSV